MDPLETRVRELIDEGPGAHIALSLGLIARRTLGDAVARAVLAPATQDERIGGFWRLTAGVADEAWWSALRPVWIYHALPALAYATWLDLWACRPSPWLVMTADERAALSQLPDVVEVHRGFTGHDHRGLSWTRWADVAARYARARFALGPGVGLTPRVASGTVQRSDVLAVLRDRLGVVELVIDPGHVAVSRTYEIDEEGGHI